MTAFTTTELQQTKLDELEKVSLSPHNLALCRMEHLTNDGDNDESSPTDGLAQELTSLLQDLVSKWEGTEQHENGPQLLQIMQILHNITITDTTLAEEAAGCDGAKECYATIIDQAEGTSSMLTLLAQGMMADLLTHDTRSTPFSKVDLEDRLPRMWAVPQQGKEQLELMVHPVTSGQTEQHDVGFVMWPSAVVLSRYIANDLSLVVSNSCGDILELGAGCGLVGLTAARLLLQQNTEQSGNATDRKVILTDYNPTVLKNIDRNIRLNSLDKFASAAGLDFCDQITREEADQNPIDTPPAGWIDMEGTHHQQVALILAADVLCYSNDATMVADTIKASLVKGGKAIVVSADENQRFGVECFPEACQQAGLEVEIKHIIAGKKASSNDEEDMLVEELENTTGFRLGYNLVMFTVTVE